MGLHIIRKPLAVIHRTGSNRAGEAVKCAEGEREGLQLQGDLLRRTVKAQRGGGSRGAVVARF